MKIIFFVASLLCLNAVASLPGVEDVVVENVVAEQSEDVKTSSSVTAELISEENLNDEEIIDEVIIVTDQEEGEQALSELDEEDSEVVYVDENGDEYIVISEDYAEQGKATVRLKKKKGGKGRNCVAADGGASWYGPGFHGRKTANGEVFDQNKLTAAHNQLPYGSKVKVTNLANNQSVIVKINDRMAQHNRNIIDVTKHAAKRLGFFGKGRARVILERIQ